AAKEAGGVGVLPGGRLTLEDAYAYAKFARVALDTNDIDMRARPHSAEETQFLAACVAGTGIDVTYADLEQAPVVVLAGFEPEDESPIVFLRLRKAVRKHNQRVFSIAALASWGLQKLDGTLIPTTPGDEAATLTALAAGGRVPTMGVARNGRTVPGTGHDQEIALGRDSIVLVGERLAQVPGALAAAARLATATGARMAWVPRRAGERGAVEAGALPGLLPVGRPVTDADARAEVARVWGKAALPGRQGRDTSQILEAAAALAALEMAPFIVSLELRASAVTDRADVVFPVAAVAEKAGTFVNWEGRGGSFEAALHVPEVRTDLYVLGAIADQMDVHLGLPDAPAARAELASLGRWRGSVTPAPTPGGPGGSSPRTIQFLGVGGASAALPVKVAAWHQLL